MGGGRGGGKKHWGRMVSSGPRIELAAARHPCPWFSRPRLPGATERFPCSAPRGSAGGDSRRDGHRNGPRSGSRRARQAGRLNHGWGVLRTRCRWRSKKEATAVELAQLQSHNLTARCPMRSRQRAGILPKERPACMGSLQWTGPASGVLVKSQLVGAVPPLNPDPISASARPVKWDAAIGSETTLGRRTSRRPFGSGLAAAADRSTEPNTFAFRPFTSQKQATIRRLSNCSTSCSRNTPRSGSLRWRDRRVRNVFSRWGGSRKWWTSTGFLCRPSAMTRSSRPGHGSTSHVLSPSMGCRTCTMRLRRSLTSSPLPVRSPSPPSAFSTLRLVPSLLTRRPTEMRPARLPKPRLRMPPRSILASDTIRSLD